MTAPMIHVAGKTSAELLAGFGLSRGEVVEALMAELGLTYAEADRAWWCTAPSYHAVHSGRYSTR
jgi:hypothetical protein